MKIINLTQHRATQSQLDSGVIDLSEYYRAQLVEALNFTGMPSRTTILDRCDDIYQLVCSVIGQLEDNDKLFDGEDLWDEKTILNYGYSFMIGGAPYLMCPLQQELSHIGQVVYAYSERVSEKVVQPDGSVKKINVFKHLGFVYGVDNS